jgi:hypothetical protein
MRAAIFPSKVSLRSIMAFDALTPVSIYPRGNLNYLLRRDPFQATDSIR